MNKKSTLLFLCIFLFFIIIIISENILYAQSFTEISCVETSTTKECSNSLTVYSPRYLENGEWKSINIVLEKMGEDYKIIHNNYGVYVDTSKKEIVIDKDNEEFKIKYKGEIISFIDNTITFNITDNKMNAEIIYTFTPFEVNKLITIYDLKNNDFKFIEDYTHSNQRGNFKIIDDLIIFDDATKDKVKKNKVKKNKLAKTDNKITIELPLDYFSDLNYPIYIDPSLEITGTTSLGGDLTYDWVNVHPGGIININSTGYLNITATYNITISGTINGNGLISTANGGTGSSGTNTGGGGGGASHNKSGGNGGAGEDAGGGGAGVTYDFYNNRTLLFTGRAGGAGGRGGAGGGGKGGSALRLSAPEIKINGTINLNGVGGGSAAADSGAGGGGGGSGGKIIIEGVNIGVNDSTMVVTGGNGGNGAYNPWWNGAQWTHIDGGGGGGGAGGIIAIFYEAIFLNDSLTTTLTQGSGGAPSGPDAGGGGAGTIGTYYFEQVDNLGFSSPMVTLFLPSDDSSSSSDVIFICNASIASNEYFLNNITLHIWNPDGTFNHTHTNSTTGQINESTFYYVFTGDGAFLWNCEAANNETESDFSFADNNRTINIFLTAPAVNLQSPIDDQIFNSTENINFTYIATDEQGVDTCALYTNFSGDWEINQTNISINHIGLLNLTDGYFIWNVLCNDSLGNKNFAVLNYSFIIDTTNPLMDIVSITPVAGSQTFTFTDSIVEVNLDSCWYSIFNSTGDIDGENDNVSYTCNSGVSPTVTAFGTYNLTIYAEDLAGNENSTTDSFTISLSVAPPSNGGGGATGTSVPKNKTWYMKNDRGGSSYELLMNKQDIRIKEIVFTNHGELNVTLNLECKDISGLEKMCNYVNISKTEINIPPSLTFETVSFFTISLPAGIEDGKYDFNIVAEDIAETQNTDKLSVKVIVGRVGVIPTIISQIKGYRYLDLSFISEKAKTVPVPKLIIDLFIWVVFFLFFNLLIYRKQEHKFALAFFSSLTVVFVAFWFV